MKIRCCEQGCEHWPGKPRTTPAKIIDILYPVVKERLASASTDGVFDTTAVLADTTARRSPCGCNAPP